jgi:hypothetical protein
MVDDTIKICSDESISNPEIITVAKTEKEEAEAIMTPNILPQKSPTNENNKKHRAIKRVINPKTKTRSV